ncbi:hypothetical protein [Streptomyces spiramenti]
MTGEAGVDDGDALAGRYPAELLTQRVGILRGADREAEGPQVGVER